MAKVCRISWTYMRRAGKCVRLVLKPKPEGMTKEQSFDYYHNRDPKELFEVKEPKIAMPAEAKLFESYKCECCGEIAAANWIRIMNGKKVCLDCYETYDRFNV